MSFLYQEMDFDEKELGQLRHRKDIGNANTLLCDDITNSRSIWMTKDLHEIVIKPGDILIVIDSKPFNDFKYLERNER